MISFIYIYIYKKYIYIYIYGILFDTGTQRGGVTKKGAWGGVCGLENVRILYIRSAHTYTHEHVSTDKHNIFPEAMRAIRSVYTVLEGI